VVSLSTYSMSITVTNTAPYFSTSITPPGFNLALLTSTSFSIPTMADYEGGVLIIIPSDIQPPGCTALTVTWD
jgi:hypothetical protein